MHEAGTKRDPSWLAAWRKKRLGRTSCICRPRISRLDAWRSCRVQVWHVLNRTWLRRVEGPASGSTGFYMGAADQRGGFKHKWKKGGRNGKGRKKRRRWTGAQVRPLLPGNAGSTLPDRAMPKGIRVRAKVRGWRGQKYPSAGQDNGAARSGRRVMGQYQNQRRRPKLESERGRLRDCSAKQSPHHMTLERLITMPHLDAIWMSHSPMIRGRPEARAQSRPRNARNAVVSCD